MDSNFEVSKTAADNNNSENLEVPLNTCWTFWIDKLENFGVLFLFALLGKDLYVINKIFLM